VSSHPRLTARQLEVIAAIESSPGWSVDVAAHRLGLSRAGVAYHLRAARVRCGRCTSVGELVAYHVVPALHRRVVDAALGFADD
jgi:hypothetical protein